MINVNDVYEKLWMFVSFLWPLFLSASLKGNNVGLHCAQRRGQEPGLNFTRADHR
jgi:hypothetical protein